MISKLIATSLAFCAGVLLTTAANAQVYQLDVTSNSNAPDVLSGSFLFDSTTNFFSNASFTYNFTYGGNPALATFSGLDAISPFRGFDTDSQGMTLSTINSQLYFDFFDASLSPRITSGITELTTGFRFNHYNTPDYRTADEQATFSVTAVPEPETYAMFLAGLGLLGFARRSKKT